MTDCRIVILEYNGRALLEKCLPTIADAARKSRRRVRVTVLDNGTEAGTEEWIRKYFNDVDYVKAPANRVFCSYNDYVRTLGEKYVILLNNDIWVADGFADALIDALEREPDACFAAPRALHYETGEYEGSLSKMEFRWGLLWGTARFPGAAEKSKAAGRTMQCGFGAFRRDMFLELGGFDDLYLPGTVEDSDFCFRAYRRGWKGVYCPESVVYHIGQASFKKSFGSSGIRRINRRNLYLFVWKNIRDPWLVIQHVVLIPFQLLKYIVTLRFDFLAGFFQAVGRLPRALQKRRMSRGEVSVVPDRKIFEYSKAI